MKWYSVCSRFEAIDELTVKRCDLYRIIFNVALTATAVALVGCAAVQPTARTSTADAVDAVSTAVVKPKPALGAGQDPEPAIDYSVSMPVPVPGTDLTRLDQTSGAYGIELERGGASWYGAGFHGKRTANGERYDMNALTAAHKTLPFGTMVRVKSLVNGREVLVRITDRGPFVKSRIIDLSRAAAVELDMLSLGFKQVVLSVAEGEVVTRPIVAPRRKRR